MKDALAEFIEDYNDGLISLGDLERRLSFDLWKKDSKPMINDYIDVPRSPEEIYFTKLDQAKRMEYFRWLHADMGAGDWKILCMLASGKTQCEIAEELGVVQSTISKHITGIAKNYPELRDILHIGQHHTLAEQTPARVISSYPMDWAMHTQENGKTVCRVPEYLKSLNCESLCLYCDTCKRA